MLFLTTQPDSDYYVWQLQVQINNFKKFGCEDKCIVVFGYNPVIGINPNAKEFESKTTAKVLFYPDNRELSTRLYLPSIRPHLLKQLYRDNPEVILDQNFLYLDCDIIFADYPDFSEMNGEKYVHVSDTDDLFSYEDIAETNDELFRKMCKEVGISPITVENNKKAIGGITYAFKFFHYFNYDFWDKVERDSVALYKMMLVTNNEDSISQIMSVNKWALMWNLWLIGYDTKISNELKVMWAMNPIEDWDDYNLYNNAGVEEPQRHYLFYKHDYVEKLPFGEDFSYVSDKYCSFKYVEELISTEKALKSEN